MLRTAFCLVVSVGLVWPLAAAVHDALRVPDEQVRELRQTFVLEYRHNCNPEPGERASFLLGCVLTNAAWMAALFAIAYDRSRRSSPKVVSNRKGPYSETTRYDNGDWEHVCSVKQPT